MKKCVAIFLTVVLVAITPPAAFAGSRYETPKSYETPQHYDVPSAYPVGGNYSVPRGYDTPRYYPTGGGHYGHHHGGLSTGGALGIFGGLMALWAIERATRPDPPPVVVVPCRTAQLCERDRWGRIIYPCETICIPDE